MSVRLSFFARYSSSDQTLRSKIRRQFCYAGHAEAVGAVTFPTQIGNTLRCRYPRGCVGKLSAVIIACYFTLQIVPWSSGESSSISCFTLRVIIGADGHCDVRWEVVHNKSCQAFSDNPLEYVPRSLKQRTHSLVDTLTWFYFAFI